MRKHLVLVPLLAACGAWGQGCGSSSPPTSTSEVPVTSPTTASEVIAAAQETDDDPATQAYLRRGMATMLKVDHLSTTELPRKMVFEEPVKLEIRFRVGNQQNLPVSIYGLNGAVPVRRLRVRPPGEKTWKEHEPIWLECSTGLAYGTLAPGEEVEVLVVIPRSDEDYDLTVGVGAWEREDPPTRPPWEEWTWAWSEPLRIAAND